MSYIASNDNRLYAGLESVPGSVAPVDASSRIPAVKLSIKQKLNVPVRRDKTGTRTFTGTPPGCRRDTTYQLKTYLTSWLDATKAPGYGPLLQASLGSAPQFWAGGTITSADGTTVTFDSAHGLSAGQAVATGGEIRFVTAVGSATTVEVNAPFSTVESGATATPTITWRGAKSLPTVSLFDYWSPNSATQRVLAGAAVEDLRIHVNSDYHEFEFRGPAADVIDAGSFAAGEGGLQDFPNEPVLQSWDPGVVPGHLGQVWIGVVPERTYTLTSAEVQVSNEIETRNREFGVSGLCAVVPGQRKVTVDFDLYAGSDEASAGLYAAARQRSPMQVMFQLGEKSTQLCGVYLKSVVPEVPEFDDSEERLAWKFRGCRAQGSGDDEIIIAFG